MSTEFLLTSFVVVIMPGTGVLYTVATGLFLGRRASMFAAMGCTLGIVPSLLASITGLALLIHASALAFQVLKFAGVAYLLYLAWGMLKGGGPLSLDEGRTEQRILAVVRRGFLINILNPKLTIFFLAFLPQFVPVDAADPTGTMFVLGVVFMLMTLAVFIAYGFLATTVRTYVIESEEVSSFIQRVFAGSFAALGIRLAFASRES
ncbi:MAG: LysE family translocator [Pseudomonadota bacterium]